MQQLMSKTLEKLSKLKGRKIVSHFHPKPKPPIATSSVVPSKKCRFFHIYNTAIPKNECLVWGGKRFIHTDTAEEMVSDSEEDDATMNDFLSRFVWIMRGKLMEAYPDFEKKAIDGMLLVIVGKVVSELEKGGFDQIVGGSSSPSGDFSEDLWKTVWEVSNVVLEDMEKAKRKEKMKNFLQAEEVKEMYRFAGEVGLRGDMLREYRFKWAREKMEESEFYQSLERFKEDEEIAQEEGTSYGIGAVEQDSPAREPKLVALPKRRGKINYKIYGLAGVQDEIEWIKKEFQAMVAFLRDADKRQQRDETVAGWVKEVRILAFNAEDVIDEFLIQMATTHWNSLYFFKYLKIRYQIGSHIRKIKKQVIEVKERKDRYVVNGLMMCEDALAASSYRGTGGMSSRGPGAASPFVREDDIVGIEHDVEQLMKLVLGGNVKNFLVVSVFGMGGLGKTTLVKEVFKKSKASFDCHSWVFVSQSCNLKDVLKNILFGFIASRGEPALDVMGAMDEGWLLERTNDYLQDKKYLLVLDDIWDDNLWEELKHAFPRRKGRIIITTRLRGIASPLEDNFQIYDLQPLPYELSWSIFCNKAFRSSQGTCPDDLKEFAEAIVRKCGGLPLALVAIGGLLSCKGRNSRVWQSVLDTLDWEFNHHRDIERLNKALLFSYNHLPYYLKYCFLYLGLFPEDYEIGRKRLIRMWVAEGFVEGTAQRTEEEVANHYFVQLTDRSMIQAVTIHARDVVKACKLHDLMRDVANQMLQEEKFGSILEDVDKTIQERQRRLAIYEDADSIPSDISKLNLRSLLIFRVNELSFSALQKLLRQLKLVRVLDLQYAPLDKLPNEIGNLIHLRYLDLRGTLINELPKSVKNLRNLQTLDVRNTQVKHLPAGINELQHLRHLLLSSFCDRENGFVKMAGGGKHFVKLQTLSGIESDEDLVKQLRFLTSLRKLYIGKMTQANSKDFCQSLERMNKLRSLTVLSESPFEKNIQMESLTKSTKHLEKLKLQVHMKKLPGWFASLNCLHSLYLFKNFLTEDPFPILGKLPSLAILTLASSAYVNSIVNIPPGGFPKLKLLRILGMENWTTWMPIEKGSMPEIQFLLIADCPRLTSLPDGFYHLTCLDDLTLMGMSLVFARKLQHRDRWKISHVKEVSIISEVNGQIVKKKINTSPVN